MPSLYKLSGFDRFTMENLQDIIIQKYGKANLVSVELTRQIPVHRLFLRVGHFEVKPLDVSIGIKVRS